MALLGVHDSWTTQTHQQRVEQLLTAIAEALVSIAFTSLHPPRRFPFPTSRTVQLGTPGESTEVPA